MPDAAHKVWAGIGTTLFVMALPCIGAFILLRQVPPEQHPRLSMPDQQAQMGAPWDNRRRLELASTLRAKVRIGMDKQAVAVRLGQPDRVRDMGTIPPSEMWSYWCRDTRQHFLFVNGQLQAEELLAYPN